MLTVLFCGVSDTVCWSCYVLHIFTSLVVELDIQVFPTTPCIKAVKAKSGLVWLVSAKLNYNLISKCLFQIMMSYSELKLAQPMKIQHHQVVPNVIKELLKYVCKNFSKTF